jgi:hypothetical protein
MATIILDTAVGDPWIDAISQLEVKMEAIQARGRVKASKDLGDVAQALGIVVSSIILFNYCLNIFGIRQRPNYGHFSWLYYNPFERT